MEQLIRWEEKDWNRTTGWVNEQHVATLEWSAEGHWKVRPHFPSAAAPLARKHTTLEAAKQAATDWWVHVLDRLGARPAEPAPDLSPESLAALVTDVRAAVLRHSSVDYQVYKRRAHDALAYMDQVISPSQITLDHIRRILKGE